jgi:hypothetical protein
VNPKTEELIEAVRAWAAAKRAWEETSRMIERPDNLSRIKGDLRRAERELLEKADALEDGETAT